MAAGVSPNLARTLAFGMTILLAITGAVYYGSWRHARGPANQDPEQLATIDGFTTYAVPSAKFSMAVPQSWRTFTAEEAFADSGALDQLTRENPEFAQFRDVLSDPRSPMKLIAIDPNVRGGFATNANVIAQDVPDDFSFEDFVRESEAELRALEGMTTGLQSKTVDLRAGKAQRLTYEGHFTFSGQERSIATLQYGLVADGWTYVITFTTLPEFADEYENDFERSIGSFSTGD
jgi:hypothetical protein